MEDMDFGALSPPAVDEVWETDGQPSPAPPQPHALLRSLFPDQLLHAPECAPSTPRSDGSPFSAQPAAFPPQFQPQPQPQPHPHHHGHQHQHPQHRPQQLQQPQQQQQVHHYQPPGVGQRLSPQAPAQMLAQHQAANTRGSPSMQVPSMAVQGRGFRFPVAGEYAARGARSPLESVSSSHSPVSMLASSFEDDRATSVSSASAAAPTEQVLVLGHRAAGKSTFVQLLARSHAGGRGMFPKAYLQSHELEHVTLAPSQWMNTVRILNPPAHQWQRSVSLVQEDPLLGSALVRNPFLELAQGTTLLVYVMSLADVHNIPIHIDGLSNAASRWFRGVPVLVLFTHYPQFAAQIQAGVRLCDVFPNFSGSNTPENALKYVAKETLMLARRFAYAKVRILRSQMDAANPSHVVKTLEESNAFRVFAETFHVMKMNKIKPT